MSFFTKLLDNLDSALNQLSAEEGADDAVPLPSPHMGRTDTTLLWVYYDASAPDFGGYGGYAPPSPAPSGASTSNAFGDGEEREWAASQSHTPQPRRSNTMVNTPHRTQEDVAPSPALGHRRASTAGQEVDDDLLSLSTTLPSPLPGPQHQFEREPPQGSPSPSPLTCAMCRSLWDDGGSTLFPFYRCTHCPLLVHAACRDFAHKAFSCPAPPLSEVLRPLSDPSTCKVNCAGVVSVKLRQAYDLPVTPGTSLFVRLCLLPWKEKLKTPTAEVAVGKEVVWWSELSAPKGVVEPKALTLMHVYNSDATPLPTLRLDVCSSALQGILEHTIGTVELSMLPLMARPGVEAERWHRILLPTPSPSSPSPSSSHGGMLLLSTCFTPTKALLLAASHASHASPSSSLLLLPPPPSPGPLPLSTRAPPTSASATNSNGPLPAVPPAAPVLAEHLFRLTSYVLPVFCGVCDGLVLGLRRQGYRCELCGLDVHRHCQLKAALHRPCPGPPTLPSPPAPPLALPPNPPLTPRQSLPLSANGDAPSTPHPPPPSFSSPPKPLLLSSPPPLPPPSPNTTTTALDASLPPALSANTTGEGVPPSLVLTANPNANTSASASASATGNGPLWSSLSLEERRRRSALLGIGTLHVTLKSAHHCSTRCSKGVHALDVVLDGDYYVRFKLGPTTSRRTRTVFQTADPHFDESWPNLVVPHYRAVLVLELIDAAYDRAVGKVELPVFKLLQQEADALAEGRPQKKGQEQDYTLRDNQDREVGYLRLCLVLEEDADGLFLAGHPRRVPLGPKEDLAVENLRRVIERMQAVIALLSHAERAYSHVMNWEQPYLTGALMLGFVYCCLVADAERAVGVLCASSGILLLSYLGWERRSGAYRRQWTERGDGTAAGAGGTAGEEEQGEGSSNKSKAGAEGASEGAGGKKGSGKRPHRCMGRLRVCVDQVRYPSSSVWGLGQGQGWGGGRGGRTYVTVSYALTGEASDVENDLVIGCLANTHNDTPSTDSHGNDGTAKELDVEYSLPPVAAAQFPRADRGSIFRNVVEYSHPPPSPSPSPSPRPPLLTSTNRWPLPPSPPLRYALLFPVMQPLGPSPSASTSTSASSKERVLEPLPFSASPACLRLRVYYEAPGLSTFDDECLGQVLIPIKLLSEAAVGGWFPLRLGATTHASAPPPPPPQSDKDLSEPKPPPSSRPSLGKLIGPQPLPPPNDVAVLVTAELQLPNTAIVQQQQQQQQQSSGQDSGLQGSQAGGGSVPMPMPLPLPSAVEVRESRAFEDMLDENNMLLDNNAGGQGVVSSLWNLPSTVKAIQNLLEEWLGWLESLKNLLNWTHPNKTLALYLGLWLGLGVLLVVPSRYLVLGGGVYQFLYKFFPEQDEYPNVIRAENLIHSLPNDEDLRRIYYHENQEFLRHKRDKLQNQRQRRSQLTGLWSCVWEGKLMTRASSSQPWRPAYVVVQGHRVLLFRAEKDMERGGAPEGQIVLRGHAGLTSPSPVEMKELGAERAALLVCVFGKNVVAKTQEKRSFLMANLDEQKALTDALIKAMDFKQS